MDNTDIEQRKYELLKRAVEKVRKQYDAYDKLKVKAFEVLYRNPGSDFFKWVEMLIMKYYSLIIDAYGTDPATISASLQKLWTSLYLDEASGWERTIEEWAETFSTQTAVDNYLHMTIQEQWRSRSH